MAGNPANPVLMIQTMLQQKRFAEAEAAAASLVRQKPGPQTTVIEAQVMVQTRGAEVAVKALQAAALKFPASPEVQNALAQTCMAAKRFDDAAVACPVDQDAPGRWQPDLRPGNGAGAKRDAGKGSADLPEAHPGAP